MNQNIVLLVALFLVLVMLLPATATVISAYSSSTNPICQTPGVISLDTTDLQIGGAAGINFDYAANYYDSYGNSAPLLIRKGDGTSFGYKFLTYSDNTLLTVQESECTGTATGVFVSFIG